MFDGGANALGAKLMSAIGGGYIWSGNGFETDGAVDGFYFIHVRDVANKGVYCASNWCDVLVSGKILSKISGNFIIDLIASVKDELFPAGHRVIGRVGVVEGGF